MKIGGWLPLLDILFKFIFTRKLLKKRNMKKVILVFGLILNFLGFSQEYYTKQFINTSLFGDGEIPAVEYKLQKVKLESFKKDCRTELKKHANGDVVVEEFEIIGNDVYNEEISKSSYKVFTHFKSFEGGVEFTLSFKDSVNYIDLQNDPSQVEINNYLDAFVTSVYVKSLNAELNVENGTLKKLNNEVEKTNKTIIKKEKENMKLTAQIEQTEQQLKANEGQYESLLSALQAKNTELAGTAKKSEGYDQIKKEAKGLDKNKKKMESEKLKLNEFVYDSKATIESNLGSIKDMEDALVLLDDKIKTQKGVVLDIEEEIYKINRP